MAKKNLLCPFITSPQNALLVSLHSFSDCDSFKPNLSLCRDSEPLYPECGLIPCPIQTMWFCLPLDIFICSSVQIFTVHSFMQGYLWLQTARLDAGVSSVGSGFPAAKHWSPSNAPYSLTRWSKGLTCSAYPGKHVLILPPAEVHILYVESHLESSERNAFYTENMFLTLKKYLSVTMQDRVLHKGLALWFIIFFYERRAWEL